MVYQIQINRSRRWSTYGWKEDEKKLISISYKYYEYCFLSITLHEDLYLSISIDLYIA